MTPDIPADDLPTKPLPEATDAASPVAPDPGLTEPIIAPHVPVADLSTAPFEPAILQSTARIGPRPTTWALIALVAVLGISAIVFGTL